MNKVLYLLIILLLVFIENVDGYGVALPNDSIQLENTDALSIDSTFFEKYYNDSSYRYINATIPQTKSFRLRFIDWLRKIIYLELTI